MTTEPRPPRTAVVLDANVWVKELGLRTAAGSAFLHSLRTLGGHVVLPDVVKWELTATLMKRVAESRQAVEKGLNTIRAVAGEEINVQLPADDEVAARIESWLNDLDPLVAAHTPTEAQYQIAIQNAVHHRAPSHTREQVRDDLVWQAVLDAGARSRAILVTGDKDFWRNDSLHPDLRAQADEADIEVRIFRDVRSCVRTLAPEVDLAIDRERILAAIWRELRDPVTDAIEQRAFRIVGIANTSVTLYATENPHRPSIEFSIALNLEDVYDEEALGLLGLEENLPDVRTDALATIEGAAFLDAPDKASEALIDMITFVFRKGGEPQGFRSMFERAGSLPGPGRHRVRTEFA